MFLTFEGPEGGGKTLAVAFLAAWLRERGLAVRTVREPGGTALGEAVREVLLHGQEQPVPAASLLLFSAARAQLVERVVRPALAAGEIVICDRFIDSTVAYQGHGEGLPLEAIELANQLATRGLRPDLTVLLDLDPVLGLGRRERSAQWDAMDARSPDFHRRVRAGFLGLARAAPERWLTLDAAQPLPAVHRALLDGLRRHPRWRAARLPS